MAGMLFQPRVIDFSDFGMLFEPFRHYSGIFAVLVNSQGQCFQAAQKKPAVKRWQNCAGRVLQEVKFFTKLFVSSDENAGTEIVMAAQIFGGAIDDDVGAELERPLQDRAEE